MISCCVRSLLVQRMAPSHIWSICLAWFLSECPIQQLIYIPLADVERPTVYDKYDVSEMNTACRFIAKTKTREEDLLD